MYGVGKSSTTGSTDTTSAEGSSGGGIGKRSRVEAELGAASGGGEKRGREDEDEGDREGRDDKRIRGEGGGGASSSARGAQGGFPFKIGGEVGSFRLDRSAAVSNAVQGPPAAQPEEGTAYVGNIITIARGKDKTPVQVAEQYRDEAFDDPAQAQQRFALVVGVNRMESVTESTDAQAAPLDQALAQVQGFQQFPLAAFRRLWRPDWRHSEGPNRDQPADFDEVRAAAARHQDAALRVEESSKKIPPVGPMRTETTQHQRTRDFTQLLQQRYTNVFVHVGDADAVNLKAKTSPTSERPASGLFDRYDQVLADARARGVNPKLVSGGYHFRVGNQYLAPEHQHADPHAGEAGRVSPQTAASSMLDMEVRQGLADVDPSRVYFPEPNLLIHSSVADQADFGQSNVNESKRLVESLHGGSAPDRAQATQSMVFDTRAGLYTDGGRFDRDMTQNFRSARGTTGDEYRQGAMDLEGLTHNKRNPQSIAKKRDLGNAIARMNGDIGAILDVYLPQQLMKLAEPAPGGTGQQSTLDRVRDYLEAYATIAGGIDQQIRDAVTDESSQIPAKAKGELSGSKINAEAPGVHEGLSPELHDFSTAGLGSAQQLSRELVKAIAAAKSFVAKSKAPGKEAKRQELFEALNLCKSAAVKTAGFLAQFFPQAAMAVQQPQQGGGPQVAQGPDVQQPQQGVLGPAPMDLDAPETL